MTVQSDRETSRCPRHPNYRGVSVAHRHTEHRDYTHSHEMPCCDRHEYASRPHEHGDTRHSHPHSVR
jgi:hypothetical protein